MSETDAGWPDGGAVVITGASGGLGAAALTARLLLEMD